LVVLLLQVPRTNDKKELAAEQMFASLHGLLLFPSQKLFKADKRVRLSFEIAVLKKKDRILRCGSPILKKLCRRTAIRPVPERSDLRSA
jgi:hypothetical protein